MGDRKLRKRWQGFVDGLNIPHPFSLEGFLCELEVQRARKIEILPLPLEISLTGTCGLWLATKSVDFVFYEADSNSLHGMQIITHEIVHILIEKPTADVEGLPDVSGLMPMLDPDLIRRSLKRTDYEDSREKDAEMVASLIVERALGSSRVGRRDDLGRLGEMLGTDGY